MRVRITRLRTIFGILLSAIYLIGLAGPAVRANAPPADQTVQSLIDSAIEAVDKRPKDALRSIEDALQDLVTHPDPVLYIRALAIKSKALTRLGQYDEALNIAQQAIRQAEQGSTPNQVKSEAYVSRGFARQYLGNIAEALVDYQQAYDLLPNNGENTHQSHLLINLGLLYLEAEDISRAIEYFDKALVKLGPTGNDMMRSRLLNNLGFTRIKNGEPEKAVPLLEEALKNAARVNSPLAVAYINENLGEAYYHSGHLDQAERQLLLGLGQAKSLGLDSLAGSALQFLGRVAAKRKQPDKGLAYAKEAYGLVSSSNEVAGLREVHELYATLYEQKGDYQKALTHLKAYIDYDNKLRGEDTQKRLSLLETQFKLKQKENQIEILRRDGEINTLLLQRASTTRSATVIGAIFLFGIIVTLTLLLKAKAKATAQAEEKTRELLVTQERLEKANKIKSDILAMTSHEVRTPLNGIMGMAQILQTTKLDKEQSMFVETIRSSGELLLSILNDILDVSKIEAGKLDIHQKKFSIRDLMENMAKIWQSKAESKGLAFNVSVPDRLPEELIGDGNRIQQILYNLVANAIKFTEKGSVSIKLDTKVRSDGRMALNFEVIDTGIGISDEFRGSVFEPFSQADTGSARSFGGTGLGLAICRQLTVMMGGEIGLDSAPQEGSRFWFKIPCQIVSPALDEAHAAPAPAEQAHDNKAVMKEEAASEAGAAYDNPANILVVEDNKLNQMVIEGMLQPYPLRLSLASNGQQAVEMAREGGFDLILMDVHMPVMDGMEATKAIRNLSGEASHVPIIALTADAMVGDKQRVLNAGMDDYISKPIAVDKLVQVINKHLAMRRRGAQKSAETEMPAAGKLRARADAG